MIIELNKVPKTKWPTKAESTINDTFRIVAFVLRARSKDPIRAILEYLYIEEKDSAKTLVCTDGRRLHFSDPLKELSLEPGLYRVLKSTPNQIWIDKMTKDVGTYPNWRQVVPDKGEFKQTHIQCADKTMDEYRLCVKFHQATGGFYQLTYLRDALPVDCGGIDITVSCDADEKSSPLNPITISHKHGKCVLMPMRVT